MTISKFSKILLTTLFLLFLSRIDIYAQTYSCVDADIQKDDKVDIADYRILIENFFKTGTPGDINGDNFVDLTDYGILIENFFKTCPSDEPTPTPPVVTGNRGPQPISLSQGEYDVLVTPETPNIPSLVSNAPEGTRFYFQPGYYKNLRISPKNNQQFIGGYSASSSPQFAIFDGSIYITGFTQDGSIWKSTGQTLTPKSNSNARCESDSPRCIYREDLFVNDEPYKHVASVSDVVSGTKTWHFDYSNDVIYIGTNPSGVSVTLSETDQAFNNTGDNIAIKNLVVQKYSPQYYWGAIAADRRTGWVLDQLLVQLNHSAGVMFSYNTKVTNTILANNGVIGAVGKLGTGSLFQNNEMYGNNYANHDIGWESGGVKFTYATDLQVLDNYSHDNNGPGLWTDIDNVNTTYTRNLVENNQREGIKHEISYSADIHNNVVRNNGIGDDNWLWGAQIHLHSSADTIVRENQVTVHQNYGDGIVITGDPRDNEGVPYIAQNNTIENNTVTHLGTVGQNGAAGRYSYTNNNVFKNNIYRVANLNSQYFKWGSDNFTFSEFQSIPQETGGNILAL